MQAIQTKYIAPTNHRDSRIKAWCEAGSITIDYPYEYEESGAHLYAALTLQSQLGWNGPNYGELHQGALPNNAGYCHVMVKSDNAVNALLNTLYSNAAESPQYIRDRIDKFNKA